MSKSIISIGYEIPGFSDRCHEYTSDQSLLDGDIIVFETVSLADSSGGKPTYTDSYSFALRESTKHWRREVSTALEHGKTVFLMFRKYNIAQLYTGQKEFKGRTQINYVEDFNNYEFLPIKLPEIVSKGGSAVVFTGDPVFATLWKEFGSYLRYESYLAQKTRRPVFVTKTGRLPIGGVFTDGKGHLVLLPPIDYDEENFITNSESNPEWTKEAITFGNRLVNLLSEIDHSLKQESTKTPAPEWVAGDQFKLKNELQLEQKIVGVSATIATLTEEAKSLRSNLENEIKLKDLLFETGKPLEAAVTLALMILGYSAENYDDGTLELDQVIVSPEGGRFIGECEGKDAAAINIDKLRQLEENIQSDLQREDVEKPAVGILFGNGFRLTPPNERQEQFTTKCLVSAKRGTILIRTANLFSVARYVRETDDEDFAKQCREAILSGTGDIVQFPALPS